MKVAVGLIAAFEIVCGFLAAGAAAYPRVPAPVVALAVALLGGGALLLRHAPAGYWLSYAALATQAPIVISPSHGYLVAVGAWVHVLWRFMPGEVHYSVAARVGQLYISTGGTGTAAAEWVAGGNLLAVALIAVLAADHRRRRPSRAASSRGVELTTTSA